MGLRVWGFGVRVEGWLIRVEGLLGLGFIGFRVLGDGTPLNPNTKPAFWDPPKPPGLDGTSVRGLGVRGFGVWGFWCLGLSLNPNVDLVLINPDPPPSQFIFVSGRPAY